MDEKEFRTKLSKEELQKRALILPFKIIDINVFEQLNKNSTEFGKTYDEIINTALIRFFDDIDAINKLRL